MNATAPSDEQNSNSRRPSGMSLRSIITTLVFAIVTAVSMASVGYPSIKNVAAWTAENLFPIEPCMLIAASAAIVGCVGYLIQMRWFPAPEIDGLPK